MHKFSEPPIAYLKKNNANERLISAQIKVKTFLARNIYIYVNVALISWARSPNSIIDMSVH